MDTTKIAKQILGMVPFAGTIGVVVEAASHTEATCTMAFRPDIGNHVGTPHAGALFTLGESCSGALMAAVLGDLIMSQGLLVVLKEATVRYRKPVNGDAHAVATMAMTAAEIRAAVEADGRIDVPVDVHVTDHEGGEGTTIAFLWAVRARR